MKDERLKRGKLIAYTASQKIILPKSYQEKIDTMITVIPNSGWLSKFCTDHEIHLKNPSSLEEARKFCCNIKVINDFFMKNQAYLKDTDGRLIFNADETSSITTKKYKALVLEKKINCINFRSSARSSYIHDVMLQCNWI